MNEAGIKNLVSAITMQAVRDYFHADDDGKRTILRELRSDWMITLTCDMSTIVAEQLEKHPEEIQERLRRNNEDMV